MLSRGQSSLLSGALAIAILTFLQFTPSLNFDFLGWDDTAYIQEDAVVSQGLGKDSVYYAFNTFQNPYFMPLTRLSYMLDVSLFGLKEAAGFRLTNILFHIANSVLLFFLVYRVSRRYWAAFFTGVIFALHPQHVEAVVWIAGRKELLAGFFGLIGLLGYQEYAVNKKRVWYLVALLAYGASLLCKPIWIALPVLLLLWDFFPLKRISRANCMAIFAEKLPFFIIGLLFSLIFMSSIQTNDVPVSYFPDAPWSKRWLLPFIAMGNYVGSTFMPFHLLPYYAFPDTINVIEGLIWVSVLAILLALFWRIKNEYPGFLLALLWFAFALIPPLKLTLSPTGEAIFIGDRYSYLSHIGIFVGIILSLDSWMTQRSKAGNAVVSTLLLLMMTGMLYSAHHVIMQWKTPETLWRYTFDHTEGKGKAYVLGILASSYEKQKRYEDAVLAYKKAHDIYPQQFIYPLMVASLLSRKFRMEEESNLWYDKVLDESPAPTKILAEYGGNQFMHGHSVRAESFLAKAIERNKKEGWTVNTKDIYVMLGLAQLKNNHKDTAIDSLHNARLDAQEKQALCKQLFPGDKAMLQSEKNPVLFDYCYGQSGK